MEKEIDWIKVINFSPIWINKNIKGAAPLPNFFFTSFNRVGYEFPFHTYTQITKFHEK